MLGRFIISFALIGAAYLIKMALDGLAEAVRRSSSISSAYEQPSARPQPRAAADPAWSPEVEATPAAEPEPVASTDDAVVVDQATDESEATPVDVPASPPLLRLVPTLVESPEASGDEISNGEGDVTEEPTIPLSPASPLAADPAAYDALADALAKAAAEYEAEQLLTGKVGGDGQTDEGPRYRAAGWNW